MHDLIKQTCTLFYVPVHEWDTEFMGNYVEFIEESNAIRQKFTTSSSSFLKQKFKSGVHHWRFRIDKCAKKGYWTTTLGYGTQNLK